MADERKDERDVAALASTAFELRLSGASYSEIAGGIGCSAAEARQLVARRAREVDAELDTPADVDTLALARVDAMLLAFAQRARAGDERAAGLVLALERRRDVVLERRRKAAGLDSWKLEVG